MGSRFLMGLDCVVTKEFNAEMGKRIAQRRKELGITREQLASDVGITLRFLFDIEAGKKGMSLETFVNLNKALDVSADWFLYGC